MCKKNLDRAAEAADTGNVDEVYRIPTPWMKPHHKALSRIWLGNGQWAWTPDEAAEQRRLQYEATFKGQFSTRVELATDKEQRAASREACRGDHATHGG